MENPVRRQPAPLKAPPSPTCRRRNSWPRWQAHATRVEDAIRGRSAPLRSVREPPLTSITPLSYRLLWLQQAVHLYAQCLGNFLYIIKGNISYLSLDMRDKGPVQFTFKCKHFLRPAARSAKTHDVRRKDGPCGCSWLSWDGRCGGWHLCQCCK